jgi:hypothetical protein
VVSRPLVRTDPAHGGRWTSLRAGGREWLWTRPDRARDRVRPGDAFVDAGGLEECLPTVRGTPDHGAVWSRPWRRTGGAACVTCPDFTLQRRISVRDTGLRAVYRLTAAPGYRFVWAAHALLDLGVGARLHAPAGTPTWVDPGRVGPWPAPAGVPLDEFGPDDGTATGAVLRGCRTVTVTDGPAALRLRLTAPAGVPVSVALFRNLGGFPATGPYRTIGVEPMLGTVFDLADAGPADAATVPATGELRWHLDLDTPGTADGTP